MSGRIESYDRKYGEFGGQIRSSIASVAAAARNDKDVEEARKSHKAVKASVRKQLGK